jgi:hypothetical protein
LFLWFKILDILREWCPKSTYGSIAACTWMDVYSRIGLGMLLLISPEKMLLVKADRNFCNKPRKDGWKHASRQHLNKQRIIQNYNEQRQKPKEKMI